MARPACRRTTSARTIATAAMTAMTPESQRAAPAERAAFTLSRASPQHTGTLTDTQMVEILSVACGRYGSTLDYLVETANSLRGCGIRDREIERLVTLARRHDLTA